MENLIIFLVLFIFLSKKKCLLPVSVWVSRPVVVQKGQGAGDSAESLLQLHQILLVLELAEFGGGEQMRGHERQHFVQQNRKEQAATVERGEETRLGDERPEELELLADNDFRR